MRVLVTGATGFVGSHCLEALIAREDVEPVAACRAPERLLPAFDGQVRAGDLRDAAYLETLCEGVDVIIHAAAWTALWGHKAHSDALFLAPSLALLEAAKRAGVQRFMFVSTVSAPHAAEADDPFSPGVRRAYWPHEVNVVRIEDRLRELAGEAFCTVNMRLGLFAGARFALGLLPVLAPRLKTHLVPFVAGGRTLMPVIDGRDVGQALALAATQPGLKGFEAFNAVGPETPSAREVLDYLHSRHGLPLPHFSVPFPAAFAFAWLMEKLDPIMPFEPLVTRSIIHLLQLTKISNRRAAEKLGYAPRHHWKQTVDLQLAEMARSHNGPMKLARPRPAA